MAAHLLAAANRGQRRLDVERKDGILLTKHQLNLESPARSLIAFVWDSVCTAVCMVVMVYEFAWWHYIAFYNHGWWVLPPADTSVLHTKAGDVGLLTVGIIEFHKFASAGE